MREEFKELNAPNDNNKKQSEKYEADYKSFKSKLDQVASFEPKSKYLYAIMDGVPFKDTENALDIAIDNKPVNKGG